MAGKDQKLIFTIRKTLTGKMSVNMSFYPPLSNNKEHFDSLPMQKREMQNVASDLGRYAMMRLAQSDKEKNRGKEDIAAD